MKLQKHYKPNLHIYNLVHQSYYKNLIQLRNTITLSCDVYFQKIGAPKVDLFLITQGITSPMGKGSDSLPLPFRFGNRKAFLADSSQFGMEPLVQQHHKIVYCYLPSFRGEKPDDHHLNQFFHCESEMRGNYHDAMKIAEGLVKFLTKKAIEGHRQHLYTFRKHNFKEVEYIIDKKFPIVKFDEAVALLERHRRGYYVQQRSYGRIISRGGETEITRIVSKNRIPVWISHYDRDVVPFYQKPDPTNPNRALCADLIFPPIKGSFGGEDIGLGQRQDLPKEIVESLTRQGIRGRENYRWYMNLRKDRSYQTTSGFGFGIERFLAWLLRLRSINDVALYPVNKFQRLF